MTKQLLGHEGLTRRLKKELKNFLRVPAEEQICAQLESSGAFECALSKLLEHRSRSEVMEGLRGDYWAKRSDWARSQPIVTTTEKRRGIHLEAMAWRAAALADQREDVQKFRDEVLSGGVLEPEEIARFHATRSDPAICTRLREIARKLSQAFRWSEADGELFVLTADAPEPLKPTFGVERNRLGQPDWITLSYDAHTTEENVLEMHRAARARLEHGLLKLGANLSTRTVSLETAELAALIDEVNDGRTTWESAMDTHNERYPERRREDVGNFAMAAASAFRSMYQADLDWAATPAKIRERLAQAVEDAQRKERSKNEVLRRQQTEPGGWTRHV